MEVGNTIKMPALKNGFWNT